MKCLPPTAPSYVPKPTGPVTTIEMTADETGNTFKMKNFEAKPGDANLPPMSTFAQLPEQELLVPVKFEAGKSYSVQCDRHAVFGVFGKLDVGQQ